MLCIRAGEKALRTAVQLLRANEKEAEEKRKRKGERTEDDNLARGRGKYDIPTIEITFRRRADSAAREKRKRLPEPRESF